MNNDWTESQENELKELYSYMPAAKFAKLFNKSVESIYEKARSLGISRYPDKGVTYDKQKRKFRARRMIDGTSYDIGLYAKRDEAIKAYKSFQGKPPDSETP